MQKIIRNTILKYVPSNFSFEYNVNSARIFEINNKEIKQGYVVYLMERELRAKDNFALQFAIQKSKEFDLPLKILCPELKVEYKPKQEFLNRQIQQVKENFIKLNIDFFTVKMSDILGYLEILKTTLLIIDFNPILNRVWYKDANFKIYEVDGHNIIPARFVSDKQEYNASTLRRKIYKNIYPFLTEFDNIFDFKIEADEVLEQFIKNKLPFYAQYKNNIAKDVLSGLSKYLNLGFISSQRVALEVIKSKADDTNKEAFLEELIVRKELADNFCFYCKGYKNFSCIPKWAYESLNFHKKDFRQYIYTIKELEQAKTHDRMWNIAQKQLLHEGLIHGYLRMYWAKKLLEWTKTPQEALEFAIYLNDRYAYDAPSSNGYVGILWSIAGLHDRAFRDYPITGKIRRMSAKTIKQKFIDV